MTLFHLLSTSNFIRFYLPTKDGDWKEYEVTTDIHLLPNRVAHWEVSQNRLYVTVANS